MSAKSSSMAWRLTVLLQAVTFAVVVIFAASALILTLRDLEREERMFLLNTARAIAASVDRELVEEGDLGRAAVAAIEEGAITGVHVEVFDPSGHRLASSTPATTGPAAAESRTSGPHREIAVATCGAVAVASVSDRLVMLTTRALGRALLIAAIPLLVIATLISRRLVRRALAPLGEIGQRARNTAVDRGAFTLGPHFGLDELDELVDSFDRLLGRLDTVLQAERRFSRDASHELKTPLTVIRGELELLRSRQDLSPDVRSAMERVLAQVNSMTELVEALLLLRRTDLEPAANRDLFEPVNLADIAREVVQTALQHHPERQADLVLNAPDEILVPAHPVLLAAAVRNLVDNAVKFTCSGQPIQVGVEATSEASLVVDDGGRGVPLSEREFIFDPFYRGGEARAETNGFGLGLPILRQVARAHGGEVLVQDSPLGGARFSFRLPLWTAIEEGSS